MIDAVLDTCPPLSHEQWLRSRPIGVHQPVLGRDLRLRADHHEAFAAGSANTHPEPLVILLVGLDVVGGVGSHDVAYDPVGALGLVGAHREQRRVVICPHQPVAELRESAPRRRHVRPVQHVAGRDVDHRQRVLLVAVGVGGVGEQAVIWADRQVADGEVLVALCQLVLVEQHHLVIVGAAPRPPHMDDVLQPLHRAGPVLPVVLRRRQRLVGLGGAGLDLAEDLLAQIGQVGCRDLGEGVLCLEVLPHGRVVPLAQPVPGVVGLGAVDAPHVRPLRCHRRLRHGARTVPAKLPRPLRQFEG